MKISIILGTRPEIIKMSPIIKECERRGLKYFILHSGQHYTYNMDKIFFEQLHLPDAKYNLDTGPGTHAEQTGKMLIMIEAILKKETPDIVLVEGDTNTVLAGALAASKLHIKIGHVEAGLRSYDMSMPEEINRILTDHCSNILFAPTNKSKDILLEENISEDKIFVTGNTIVDVVYQNLKKANKNSDIFNDLGIEPREYFLLTLHRGENVDDYKRLRKILYGMKLLSNEFEIPIIYPIHPRTKKMINRFGFHTNGINLIEPLDYIKFLQLESYASIILTDSGGVQEEACVLGIPCVTLRENTERPETLDVGSNILAGSDPERILECSKLMLNRDNKWENPFGDGNAGKRIIDVLNIYGV